MSESWRQPRRIADGGTRRADRLLPARADAGDRPDELHRGADPVLPAGGLLAPVVRADAHGPAVVAGCVNSLQVAVLTAILATVLGTLAALGLMRGRFPGRIARQRAGPVAADRARHHHRDRVVRAVRAVADQPARCSGSSLAHTALAMPFVDHQRRRRSLRTMDRNLELAAANLGPIRAGHSGASRSRSSCPGVLAGAIFAFITSWDEVVVAIFMTSARFRTLPVEMWEQVRQVVDPTVAAVATTCSSSRPCCSLLLFVVRRQAPSVTPPVAGRRRGAGRRPRAAGARRCADLRKAFGERRRRRRRRPGGPPRRVRDAARPVGFGQDDDPADDRRASRPRTKARSRSTART